MIIINDYKNFNMINLYKPKLHIIIVLTHILSVIYGLQILDPEKTKVWGPGLSPDEVTLPARYFFVQAVDRDGIEFSKSPPLPYSVKIEGTSYSNRCIYSIEQIDRGDGSTIIRYKLHKTCQNININIKYNGSHIASSPYKIRGAAYPEKCYCPQELDIWIKENECSNREERLNKDLQPFKEVNFSSIREKLLSRYDMPGGVSLCNYVVKNNEIFRKCYGKYTGFKMFMDATLLSITRKVKLPDFEFFLNLGDYPLVQKNDKRRDSGPFPIFSWCGSDDSLDIVLPTYDITQSTLEAMSSVTLDMLSVQKHEYDWNEKEERAMWRGRDSRRERLDLIDLARSHPDLLNASITNFFFYRDEEEKYGPRAPHIPLPNFFKFKYVINIDGTVASYRLPYLLGGNSAVFKQSSPFYEHFYHKLVPNKHYIPFKRDLSDLVAKVKWAKQNDAKVKEMMKASQQFVQENLLPVNIYCYHVLAFKEWSERVVQPVIVLPHMEKVPQEGDCDCFRVDSRKISDEL